MKVCSDYNYQLNIPEYHKVKLQEIWKISSFLNQRKR